jgi:hypothetical protein
LRRGDDVATPYYGGGRNRSGREVEEEIRWENYTGEGEGGREEDKTTVNEKDRVRIFRTRWAERVYVYRRTVRSIY